MDMRVKEERHYGIFIATLLISSALAATHAQAGGLWLRDYGTAAQGRAGAAEAAGVESSGTVAHNPAGMALLEENEFAAAGFAAVGDSEFDIGRTSPLTGTDDGGDAASTAPAVGMSYVHKLNDRWTFGFGIAGVTGATLDFNDDWVGRYQNTKLELLGIAAIPAISWQATDKLSLGFALPIMYTDLELDVAVPNLVDPLNGPDGQATIKGDDTNVGVLVGAIYQFNDRTRIGAIYQTEFDQSFSGDIDLQLQIGSATVGASTEIRFVQIARVGLAHEINSQYTAYLGAGWDDWSAFDDVLISTQSGGATVPTNWKDTWHASTGLKYQHSDAWTWQVGVAYDSSPVDSVDRVASLPVDEQLRIATGFTWTRNERWRFGGFVEYIDLGSAKLESSTLFGGKFDPNSAWLVGGNLQFFPGR